MKFENYQRNFLNCLLYKFKISEARKPNWKNASKVRNGDKNLDYG